MTDRANIKLDRETYEKHNERRKDHKLTWAEYIDGEAPDAPESALSDDVREQLDRIESAASTAEERTGTLERKVDELTGGHP